MGLEVIGAGFGRTGTMSLKVALEELGFGPCYHMTEVFENSEHVGQWEAAREGRANWEELFWGYRAAVDWPAAAFYEELMERYPDARVILTVRDPDRWYESARSTIYNIQNVASSPMLSLAALFVPRMRQMKRVARMASDLAWEDVFHGRFEDRQYAIEVFDRWNEEVKERVPAQKLLVYEVKEGWEPLCDFLGVAVPGGKPFPHLNDAETFRKMIRRRMALAFVALAGVASLVALALIYLRSRTSSRRA
ncbi:MAG: sulfotransferase family protein [Actinobacteria bacterium]|nr:sulfotransferase family protein [Actinomycetota bacterium]